MKAVNTLSMLATLTIGALAAASFAQTSHPATPAHPAVTYGNLPLSFEPNKGQTSAEVQWLSRGPAYTLFLAGDDAVLKLNKIVPGDRTSNDPAKLKSTVTSSAVRMSLIGAQPALGTAGEDPQSGKANYFTGNKPSNWQHDVPTYGKVRMTAVYPGIDLVYYGRQGQLEYDFLVAPGADASAIRFRFDGASPSVAANGDLVLPVNGGPEVRFNKPVVYQVNNGVRQPIDGSFAIADTKAGPQVSFHLGSYDHTRDLVIDPTFTFVGALGTGNYETYANGMAVDPSGEIVLTGLTGDVNFPVTAGAYQTVCNQYSAVASAHNFVRCGNENYEGSAFVTKISADGTSLVYSTYLHGLSGYESGQAVAIDSAGNAVVLGSTGSNDFPVTTDAINLLCQPYYPPKGVSGGSPDDFYPIQANCDGYNSSNEWYSGGPTLFISKLNPAGNNLIYSTFFGGTDPTYPQSLALDANGNIYFTSFMQGAEQYMSNGVPVNNWFPQNGVVPFPVTTSAYQIASPAQQVTTLTELSSDGGTMLYSTLFAASYSEPGLNFVQPLALAVGPNGIAYVGGYTSSDAVPTTAGAVRPACVDSTAYGNTESGSCEGYTAWLAAFDTTQTGAASLKYATYIGGPEVSDGNAAQNQILGLAADSDNNVYLTGLTMSPSYPVTTGAYSNTCTAYRPTYGYCKPTAFLTKINPAGSAYVWSTYFGGNNQSSSQGQAIAFDAKSRVYLYGWDDNYTYDLPLINPLEGRPGNSSNYPFVATFTPDGTKLLFASPVGNTNVNASDTYTISQNGMTLDADGNVYFAAYGGDGGTFPTTPGAYATPAVNTGYRTYFGKISPVRDPTATTLVVSPATSLPGQTVTFTATVAGTAVTTPSPTGTVTLVNTSAVPPTSIGTITLGTNGSGKFTTSSLASGLYTVAATYSGDTTYEVNSSAPSSFTVVQPAALISPGPGGTLAGPNVTFTWSAGIGVTGYYFQVGSKGAGSSNLYNSPLMTTTSDALTGLPTNGETIYVRLFSNSAAGQSHIDYTYLAATNGVISSPVAGVTLAGPSVTFKWTSGIDVSGYYLQIGNTGVGSSNLYNSPLITATTYSLTTMPTNGETINVRLISVLPGGDVAADYTYTAATNATISSPSAGSTLPGAGVTFNWNKGVGVAGYYLQIGSKGVGSSNLYNSPLLTSTTYTIANMPTNGEAIYVRLWSVFAGGKVTVDSTYTAASAPSAIVAPVPGSTLTGANVTFTWTQGAGAAEYFLSIGTTGVGSKNLYNPGATTALSASVTGLPTNGETIYVRLGAKVNGVWTTADYTYKAQ